MKANTARAIVSVACMVCATVAMCQGHPVFAGFMGFGGLLAVFG
jgi:hypothetical protein